MFLLERGRFSTPGGEAPGASAAEARGGVRGRAEEVRLCIKEGSAGREAPHLQQGSQVRDQDSDEEGFPLTDLGKLCTFLDVSRSFPLPVL